MTVYVDELHVWPEDFVAAPAKRYGTEWCHMWSDHKDPEELHLFAENIGLRKAWFQDHPLLAHYDLTPNKRKQALKKGAQFKSGMERAREQVGR